MHVDRPISGCQAKEPSDCRNSCLAAMPLGHGLHQHIACCSEGGGCYPAARLLGQCHLRLPIVFRQLDHRRVTPTQVFNGADLLGKRCHGRAPFLNNWKLPIFRHVLAVMSSFEDCADDRNSARRKFSWAQMGHRRKGSVGRKTSLPPDDGHDLGQGDVRAGAGSRRRFNRLAGCGDGQDCGADPQIRACFGGSGHPDGMVAADDQLRHGPRFIPSSKKFQISIGGICHGHEYGVAGSQHGGPDEPGLWSN